MCVRAQVLACVCLCVCMRACECACVCTRGWIREYLHAHLRTDACQQALATDQVHASLCMPASACHSLCMPKPLHAKASACQSLCMPKPLHATASACQSLCMPKPLHAKASACQPLRASLCMPKPSHAGSICVLHPKELHGRHSAAHICSVSAHGHRYIACVCAHVQNTCMRTNASSWLGCLPDWSDGMPTSCAQV